MVKDLDLEYNKMCDNIVLGISSETLHIKALGSSRRINIVTGTTARAKETWSAQDCDHSVCRRKKYILGVSPVREKEHDSRHDVDGRRS